MGPLPVGDTLRVESCDCSTRLSDLHVLVPDDPYGPAWALHPFLILEFWTVGTQVWLRDVPGSVGYPILRLPPA
jgi:hypothetical protein